jgi:hypothetical protein
MLPAEKPTVHTRTGTISNQIIITCAHLAQASYPILWALEEVSDFTVAQEEKKKSGKDHGPYVPDHINIILAGQ